jgi:hypothetical protein
MKITFKNKINQIYADVDLGVAPVYHLLRVKTIPVGYAWLVLDLDLTDAAQKEIGALVETAYQAHIAQLIVECSNGS